MFKFKQRIGFILYAGPRQFFMLPVCPDPHKKYVNMWRTCPWYFQLIFTCRTRRILSYRTNTVDKIQGKLN